MIVWSLDGQITFEHIGYTQEMHAIRPSFYANQVTTQLYGHQFQYFKHQILLLNVMTQVQAPIPIHGSTILYSG